jgi:ketosteroid isomerase-like protein
MAHASVELMTRFVDALGRHDEAALLELVHPSAEFTSLIQEVEGTFRGHEGLRAYLSNLFRTFPDFRVDVEEVRGGGDAAALNTRVRATGVAGGVSIDFSDWLVMRARDGRAQWWAFFRSADEAFAALSTSD